MFVLSFVDVFVLFVCMVGTSLGSLSMTTQNFLSQSFNIQPIRQSFTQPSLGQPVVGSNSSVFGSTPAMSSNTLPHSAPVNGFTMIGFGKL